MPPIQSFARESLRQTLLNRDSYATVLAVIALDTFGIECCYWTRGTLAAEFLADFNVLPPAANLDKMMAAFAILTTDQFFKSTAHFIQFCNVLCGDTFDPFEFDPATVLEMSWAITEALILSPPDEDEPFTDDIRHYIGARLKYEGFVRPPGILRIALFDEPLRDALEDYADDPELQAAARKVRQDPATRIEWLVRENVQELLDQLEKLPLTNGDAVKAVGELRRGK